MLGPHSNMTSSEAGSNNPTPLLKQDNPNFKKSWLTLCIGFLNSRFSQSHREFDAKTLRIPNSNVFHYLQFHKPQWKPFVSSTKVPRVPNPMHKISNPPPKNNILVAIQLQNLGPMESRGGSRHIRPVPRSPARYSSLPSRALRNQAAAGVEAISEPRLLRSILPSRAKSRAESYVSITS